MNLLLLLSALLSVLGSVGGARAAPAAQAVVVQSGGAAVRIVPRRVPATRPEAVLSGLATFAQAPSPVIQPVATVQLWASRRRE